MKKMYNQFIVKDANKGKNIISNKGITLIAFAISRKCVRYEERA